jgi:outer membrane protein
MIKMNRMHLLTVLIVFLLSTAVSAAEAPEPGESEAALRQFQSLEMLDLETAGRIALAGNYSLKAVLERVRQAKEKMVQARAAWFPRIDAEGSATRVRMSRNQYDENLAAARALNPRATIEDPEEYYNAKLGAGLVLFNGFERIYQNRAASCGIKESEAAHEDARRLILSSVVETFFSAQLALANLDIARADEDFNRRLLKDARARRRVGTGSLSDEYNFEIRVNAAVTSRLAAEADYEAVMFGLAALLGLPEATFPEGVTLCRLAPATEEEMAVPNAPPLIERARAKRQDIHRQEQAIQRLEAQVGVARAAFYPTLQLFASYDGDRSHNAHLHDDDFGSSVGASMTYNLFSGGGDAARVRESRFALREAQQELNNLRLQLAAEVRSAVSQLTTVQQQLKLQESNTELTRKNRDLVEKEYAVGQGSLVRLNEAQRDLITARSRLALALVSVHRAWYDLQSKTGTLVASFVPDPPSE